MKITAFVLMASFTAIACSSEHGHDTDAGAQRSAFASCQAIIDSCHEVDVGEGPVSACHDVAHEDVATEEKCAAKKTECVAVCKAALVAMDGGVDAHTINAGHADH